MKKRFISLCLIVVLVLGIFTTAFAANAGFDNFKKVNTYLEGKFSDVPTTEWFYSNVKTAFELNLVDGVSDDKFNPRGNITIAETIVLACRLNNIYYGGSGKFTQGTPWYQVYVDYAEENGIIEPGEYPNYNKPALRSEFAKILAHSIPESAFSSINSVDFGSLPDVPSSEPNAKEIYMLYNAGVLTGSDDYGSFKPDNNIQRSEVSAIITRMAIPSMREKLELKKYCSHVWGDGIESVPASCEENGELVYACTLCGETKTKVIGALGHDYDYYGVCKRCSKRMIHSVPMSAEEQNVASSVIYIGDRMVQHDDAGSYFSILFSLRDANKSIVRAPALVQIKIVNDDGVEVYSNSRIIRSEDYHLWTSALGGSKYLATIRIYDSEIEGSTSTLGTVHMLVSNDGHFMFEESKMRVSKLPLKETKLILPDLPLEVKYCSSSGRVYSKCEITSIRYDFSGMLNYIYFDGVKTYDEDGPASNGSCRFTWKIYDEENYVVDSGSCYISNLVTGDKFKNEKIIPMNLPVGETLRLEIIDG